MKFSPRFVHLLLVLGVLAIFSLPSRAENIRTTHSQVAGKGKPKKGDAPPRPTPAPGPREGGDSD